MKNLITKNNVWRTSTQTHSLTAMLLMILLHAACDFFNAHLFSLILAHLSMSLVWNIKKHSINMYVVACLLILINISVVYPCFALFTLSYEQGLLKPRYRYIVQSVHDHLTSAIQVIPAMGKPIIGANFASYPMLKDALTQLQDWVKSETDHLLVVERFTKATWLRHHGIAEHPQALSERPVVDAATIKETVKQNQRNLRNIFMIASIMLCFLAFQCILIFPVAILVYLYSCAEHSVNRLRVGSKGAPIKEGIFMVETEICGFPTGYGIGVTQNGVLHVPYHVCSARTLHIGRTAYQPYYINTEQDLVTYNGPPSLTAPQADEVLYVNCETPSARVTYMVETDLDRTHAMITWHGVTKPGESGSPIYVTRDGKIQLVGLAGRYYRDADGNVTEYTDHPETSTVSNALYQRHISHPGSGKTHKLIPEIITKHLVNNPAGRILLTGPTRVVCQELYRALHKTFPVSLVIKDHPGLKNRFHPIQIMAHHTAMSLLTKGDSCVRSLTCLIVDEAHYNDSATYQLRQYGQYMVSMDQEFHELSATLDGIAEDGSNYPIQDIKITQLQIPATIRKLLSEGKRVLVFVPSMRKKDLLLEFQSYKPIALCRETFTTAMQLVKDTENRLIISTDIAECGINIPDLDAVVDYGLKFDYFFENCIIAGATKTINTASRVQRRGRVGRVKPGEYYYVRDAQDIPQETAAMVDAKIMMTGQPWAPTITNPFNIVLSANQRYHAYNSHLLPVETHLKFRTNGEPRSLSERYDKIQELRDAENSVYYIGCENNTCKACEGKWKWFDERCHDLLLLSGDALKQIPV